jgi:hypothetical protein
MVKPILFQFRGITHDGEERTAQIKVDYDYYEYTVEEINSMISELTEAKKQLKHAITLKTINDDEGM